MTVNDYFGYGRDVTGLHDKAHEKYTGSQNPNQFEAGTLVIDIIDGKNFKLLKRGYATRAVSPALSAGQRAAHISSAVDQILRDVKFK